jgi:hypothetical protein
MSWHDGLSGRAIFVSWYSQSAERCGGGGFLAGISAVTAGAPETPAMNFIVAGSLMCIISEGMSNSPIGRATHSMRAASISTFLFCAWSVEAPHALHLQESGIGQESLNLNLNFRLALPKQQT